MSRAPNALAGFSRPAAAGPAQRGWAGGAGRRRPAGSAVAYLGGTLLVIAWYWAGTAVKLLLTAKQSITDEEPPCRRISSNPPALPADRYLVARPGRRLLRLCRWSSTPAARQPRHSLYLSAGTDASGHHQRWLPHAQLVRHSRRFTHPRHQPGAAGWAIALVRQLIDEQCAQGIALENIVLAGFSQGGAVVLYRRRQPVAAGRRRWRCPPAGQTSTSCCNVTR